MADRILGLLTSDKFKAEGDRFFNHRRKILHVFPQGGAALTALLSLMDEEETNDTQMYWHEKRYLQPRTGCRGTAPLTTNAPTTGDANNGTAVGTATLGVNTDYYLKVASTVEARNGYIIEVSGAKRIQLHVQEVIRGVSDVQALGYLRVRPVRAVAHVAADTAAERTVRFVATAMGEGAAGAGYNALGFKRPIRVENQTMIQRTPFKFSGTVLQEGLKYDKSGPYKERAKDALLEHFTNLEREMLLGKRSTNIRPSFTAGQDDEPVRTMSGWIEFLELWDAGSTGIAVDGVTYAPYNFKTADTSDDHDQKRIIENVSGTISVDKFNMWAERVGRYHASAKTQDKFVLCGSGAIAALAKMFRLNTNFSVTYGDSVYGLDFTTLLTPFGKFHFMTHPLFNEDDEWRYWMGIIDLWSMKWRPLRNRDTRLLTNRQNNGDDFRKDEYLTEGGMEMWTPESNMLVKNVREYVES